jgi:hypothetical protein
MLAVGQSTHHRYDLSPGLSLVSVQARALQVGGVRAAVVPARRVERALAARARREHLGRVGRRGRRARPRLRRAVAVVADPRRAAHRPDRGRDRPAQRRPRTRGASSSPRGTSPSCPTWRSRRATRSSSSTSPTAGSRASSTSGAPTCSSGCRSTSRRTRCSYRADGPRGRERSSGPAVTATSTTSAPTRQRRQLAPLPGRVRCVHLRAVSPLRQLSDNVRSGRRGRLVCDAPRGGAPPALESVSVLRATFRPPPDPHHWRGSGQADEGPDLSSR